MPLSIILIATRLSYCSEISCILGQLFIQNAKKHDAGTYLCTASNGIGRQLTRVISVEVRGKTIWVLAEILLLKGIYIVVVRAKYAKQHICVVRHSWSIYLHAQLFDDIL